MHKHFLIHCITLMTGAALVIPQYCAAGETSLGTLIRKDLDQTIQVEKDLQDLKKQWSDQSDAMADELGALEAQAARLEEQLEKITLRLNLETDRYDENVRREKETERVHAELTVFLDQVLSRLASGVASDLPFLEQERRGRLDALKIMLVDPGISSAEKFRRIFEALQIEAEYGITVEVTQATVTLDREPVLVDLLRLGRVALICQTIDENKSALFNPAGKAWQILPQSANRDISRAIAMARLERSIELVRLPLGKLAAQ